MITSTSNERVRDIIRLQKQSRAREEEDCFTVEGSRLASEIPQGRLVCAFASESFLAQDQNSHLCRQLKPEAVSDRVYQAMSDTRSPQGILAVVRRAHTQAEEILSVQDPLILILERLQDPGNLGTILRTAEAAGVTGIFLSEDTVDIYNPKVVRSTMGSIFRMPFSYQNDLSMTAGQLRRAGVRLYAACLEGSMEYDLADYTVPCAFMIGNEGAGLSAELTALSDCRVRIPMAGQAESLNAASACAVLAFEAARQRRRSP